MRAPSTSCSCGSSSRRCSSRRRSSAAPSSRRGRPRAQRAASWSASAYDDAGRRGGAAREATATGRARLTRRNRPPQPAARARATRPSDAALRETPVRFFELSKLRRRALELGAHGVCDFFQPLAGELVVARRGDLDAEHVAREDCAVAADALDGPARRQLVVGDVDEVDAAVVDDEVADDERGVVAVVGDEERAGSDADVAQFDARAADDEEGAVGDCEVCDLAAELGGREGEGRREDGARPAPEAAHAGDLDLGRRRREAEAPRVRGIDVELRRRGAARRLVLGGEGARRGDVVLRRRKREPALERGEADGGLRPLAL
mmetsp:Transcript_17210/g.58184  ORF Transcript_17210/g.58184 Transcript_17210/m.58184 type:complete len:320 (+) Transcript_17210:486-1445(+)